MQDSDRHTHHKPDRRSDACYGALGRAGAESWTDLIPAQLIKRCSAPRMGRHGMTTSRPFCPRENVLKSGAAQLTPSFAALVALTVPATSCRLEAASVKAAVRVCFPVGSASHRVLGSDPFFRMHGCGAGQRTCGDPGSLEAVLAFGHESKASQWLESCTVWSCCRSKVWVCSCMPANTLKT